MDEWTAKQREGIKLMDACAMTPTSSSNNIWFSL